MLQLRAQWQEGYKAAEARSKGDESAAQFHDRYSWRMGALSDDSTAERKAYEDGYRACNQGAWLSDCPPEYTP